MQQLLSVDVGKSELSACVFADSRVACRKTVKNTREGIEELFSLCPNVRVVAEATSSYHDLLVEIAWEFGRPIALARGVDVRNYARSQRTRVKTDGVDAELIGRYALVTDLRDFEPCEREKLVLRRLLRQRASLVRHRTAVRFVGSSKTLIEAFNKEIAELDKQIVAMASRQEPLYSRLQTIPGVGKIVAASLVVVLWNAEQFKTKAAITCFAGLDIAIRESGAYHGRGRLSKQGDPELRRLLFLSAISGARTKSGPIREMYLRLRQRNTNPLPAHAAICACARKLLHTAWSLARSGQDFDPERFSLALDKFP
jgi:transposase